MWQCRGSQARCDQLDDLTGTLAAGGLPTARIHQILGGNALDLLARVL
jgi:microsomal dipeptidase-like Zn-dependent dipeptidase